MTEGTPPHVHKGPIAFTCTCCCPDPAPETSVEAPSWWSWLTGPQIESSREVYCALPANNQPQPEAGS